MAAIGGIERTQGPAAAGVTALPLLQRLLVAARLWSTGGAVDLDAVSSVRDQALASNHRRHLAEIPVYAQIAAEAGVSDQASPDVIRERLVLRDDWFKSYDPDWVGCDFARLTAWLETIAAVRAPLRIEGSTDLASWRAELRRSGIFVTFSSGTGGQPSLVPRDEITLAALRSSSGVRLPWSPAAGEYDLLALTSPGMGSGIQSGAAGLAAGARRVHRLGGPGLAEFLRTAAHHQQQVVIYGPPSGLSEVVDRLGQLPERLRLPPGSCVLTGGGWKKDLPHDLATLFDAVSELLGIDRGRCVDTYSTAELNTVFVSCRDGRYHVPPVVEAVVVDDLLRPVDDPAPDGRLAVFDPFALSYPGLLATSDQVHLRQDPCACGLGGQTLLPPIRRMPGAPERGCGVVDVRAQR
ncbi:hypothetical protein [Actinopolymorpha pittospori]|uniref:Acyl-protein synthetase LuxE domain-containing protein n=1 Tax=Actinopolymorpha pittospori TaxID=648752 RepID=A0A927RBT7_9ACTN|nr:hypothetical protein [Actinopolymorpha pittospori]MBE1609124.1 hypothetical protein [Actinopolymorpha pittospori]